MKKYFVIGNPIDHSLSPELHNYWIKKSNINAIYQKKLIKEEEIENVISKIKKEEINGINVTVPFKKSVIPFLDNLSPEATEANSVNTIYKEKDKVIGHNTDIAGFELGLRHFKYNVKSKKVLILGAGGVVSSIVLALKKMGSSKIIISNRTREKAVELKKIFPYLEVIDWGKIPEFDMIINATSLGLKENDEIKLNYKDIEKKKLFFDLIYNPKQTNFLKKAEQFGHQYINGKMMFIYQAHQAFTVWHKIMPTIDDKIIKLLD